MVLRDMEEDGDQVTRSCGRRAWLRSLIACLFVLTSRWKYLVTWIDALLRLNVQKNDDLINVVGGKVTSLFFA